MDGFSLGVTVGAPDGKSVGGEVGELVGAVVCASLLPPKKLTTLFQKFPSAWAMFWPWLYALLSTCKFRRRLNLGARSIEETAEVMLKSAKKREVAIVL